MNTNSTVTRRDALKFVVGSSLAVTVAPIAVTPVVAREPSAESSPDEAAEFIPENDYPFFGFEPAA